MSNFDLKYRTLVSDLLSEGTEKPDRTGTGTLSLFSQTIRINLAREFPLLTLKRTHWPSILHELLWFLRGDTNIQYLNDNGVTIWDEWADEKGELGPIYGHQWRYWPYQMISGVDQITRIEQQLQYDPASRRMLVSAWNVADLPDMALAPCHFAFQLLTTPMSLYDRLRYPGGVDPDTDVRHLHPNEPILAHAMLDDQGIPRYRLNCQVFQRSCDVFLGLPFNIASYALLTGMFAYVHNMALGELAWIGTDTHLYSNHIDQARELLSREPTMSSPNVLIFHPGRIDSITQLAAEHIELIDYSPHPAIKAPVAV